MEKKPQKIVFDFSKPIDQQTNYPIKTSQVPRRPHYDIVIKDGKIPTDEELDEMQRKAQLANKEWEEKYLKSRE